MSKSPLYDKMRRTSRALGKARSTKADMIALQAVRRAENEARCVRCSGHGMQYGISTKCEACNGTGKIQTKNK